MRRRRSVLVTACLLAGLLPAAAAPAFAADSAKARHDRTVAYWTAERMASAIPRDFVRTDAGSFKPLAKPGTGGGNVSGASWTKGGQILKTSGKVFFTMSGTRYVCSGAVADDNRTGYSLVLTAAHCAYDETNRVFASDWLFIPEYDSAPTSTCANTKWGCWTASALVVHEGYASAGGFNTQATVHDFAFAVTGPGGKTGSVLDATVGSFDITFSSYPEGTKMYAFGYPAAGKYRGNDLAYCAGPIFYDPHNADLTYGMTCDMTGGSSGGSWLSSFSEATGSGTLSSVNSYGYSGVKAMHGPKFNSDTADVYEAADSATANDIVP